MPNKGRDQDARPGTTFISACAVLGLPGVVPLVRVGVGLGHGAFDEWEETEQGLLEQLHNDCGRVERPDACGSSGRSGSRSNARYKPALLQRLSATANAATPLHLPTCCLPGGVQLAWPGPDAVLELPPSVYSVVLTEENGAKVYASCISFLDDVDSTVACHYPRLVGAKATKVICLLSHQPYLTTMEQILMQVFLALFRTGSSMPTADLLLSILRIPRPSEMQVPFELEGRSFLLHPPSLMGLPAEELSLRPLFDALGLDNALHLFAAVLFEHRVLLRCHHYRLMTLAAESMRQLLYPFTFLHVYIPVLPYILLDYIEAPTPLLMGLHSDIHLESDKLDRMVVVDLDRGVVTGAQELSPLISQPAFQRLRTRLAHLFTPVTAAGDQMLGGARASTSDPWLAAARGLALQGWDARHDKFVRRLFLQLMASLLHGFHNHFKGSKVLVKGQRQSCHQTSGPEGVGLATAASSPALLPSPRKPAAKKPDLDAAQGKHAGGDTVLQQRARKTLAFFVFAEQHGQQADPYAWYTAGCRALVWDKAGQEVGEQADDVRRQHADQNAGHPGAVGFTAGAPEPCTRSILTPAVPALHHRMPGLVPSEMELWAGHDTHASHRDLESAGSYGLWLKQEKAPIDKQSERPALQRSPPRCASSPVLSSPPQPASGVKQRPLSHKQMEVMRLAGLLHAPMGLSQPAAHGGTVSQAGCMAAGQDRGRTSSTGGGTQQCALPARLMPPGAEVSTSPFPGTLAMPGHRALAATAAAHAASSRVQTSEPGNAQGQELTRTPAARPSHRPSLSSSTIDATLSQLIGHAPQLPSHQSQAGKTGLSSRAGSALQPTYAARAAGVERKGLRPCALTASLPSSPRISSPKSGVHLLRVGSPSGARGSPLRGTFPAPPSPLARVKATHGLPAPKSRMAASAAVTASTVPTQRAGSGLRRTTSSEALLRLPCAVPWDQESEVSPDQQAAAAALSSAENVLLDLALLSKCQPASADSCTQQREAVPAANLPARPKLGTDLTAAEARLSQQQIAALGRLLHSKSGPMQALTSVTAIEEEAQAVCALLAVQTGNTGPPLLAALTEHIQATTQAGAAKAFGTTWAPSLLAEGVQQLQAAPPPWAAAQLLPPVFEVVASMLEAILIAAVEHCDWATAQCTLETAAGLRQGGVVLLPKTSVADTAAISLRLLHSGTGIGRSTERGCEATALQRLSRQPLLHSSWPWLGLMAQPVMDALKAFEEAAACISRSNSARHRTSGSEVSYGGAGSCITSQQLDTGGLRSIAGSQASCRGSSCCDCATAGQVLQGLVAQLGQVATLMLHAGVPEGGAWTLARRVLHTQLGSKTWMPPGVLRAGLLHLRAAIKRAAMLAKVQQRASLLLNTNTFGMHIIPAAATCVGVFGAAAVTSISSRGQVKDLGLSSLGQPALASATSAPDSLSTPSPKRPAHGAVASSGGFSSASSQRGDSEGAQSSAAPSLAGAPAGVKKPQERPPWVDPLRRRPPGPVHRLSSNGRHASLSPADTALKSWGSLGASVQAQDSPTAVGKCRMAALGASPLRHQSAFASPRWSPVTSSPSFPSTAAALNIANSSKRTLPVHSHIAPPPAPAVSALACGSSSGCSWAVVSAGSKGVCVVRHAQGKSSLQRSPAIAVPGGCLGPTIITACPVEPSLAVVAPCPMLRRTASGASSHTICLVDVAAQRLGGSLALPEAGRVTQLCLSSCGSALASASAAGVVRVWDIRPGRQPRAAAPAATLLTAQARVTSLLLNPDSHQLFTADDDGKVQLWDLRLTQQPITRLQGHDAAVTAMRLLPGHGSSGGRASGHMLVTASRDWTVRVWSEDPGSRGPCDGSEDFSSCRSSSHGGSSTSRGYFSGSLWQETAVMVGHGAPVSELQVVPGTAIKAWQGRSVGADQLGDRPSSQVYMLSGAEDGSLGLWDLQSGCHGLWQVRQQSAVLGLGLSHSPATVLTGFADGSLAAWRPSPHIIGRQWCKPTSFTDPSGAFQHLQLVSEDTAVSRQSLATCAAIDSDAGVVWQGGRDGRIRAWALSGSV